MLGSGPTESEGGGSGQGRAVTNTRDDSPGHVPFAPCRVGERQRAGASRTSPAAQAVAPGTGLEDVAAAGPAAAGGCEATAAARWLGPLPGTGGATSLHPPALPTQCQLWSRLSRGSSLLATPGPFTFRGEGSGWCRAHSPEAGARDLTVATSLAVLRSLTGEQLGLACGTLAAPISPSGRGLGHPPPHLLPSEHGFWVARPVCSEHLAQDRVAWRPGVDAWDQRGQRASAGVTLEGAAPALEGV